MGRALSRVPFSGFLNRLKFRRAEISVFSCYYWSYDILERRLDRLSNSCFHRCFTRWGRSLAPSIDSSVWACRSETLSFYKGLGRRLGMKFLPLPSFPESKSRIQALSLAPVSPTLKKILDPFLSKCARRGKPGRLAAIGPC